MIFVKLNKLSMIIVFILSFGFNYASASDVLDFDIRGFKLHITVDEAKEKFKDINIIRGSYFGVADGYEANYNGMTLNFTCDELGKKLYLIRLEAENMPTSQTYAEGIYSKIKQKYGYPDLVSGDYSLYYSVCWGGCYNESGVYAGVKNYGRGLTYSHNKTGEWDLTLHDDSLRRKNSVVVEENIKRYEIEKAKKAKF